MELYEPLVFSDKCWQLSFSQFVYFCLPHSSFKLTAACFFSVLWHSCRQGTTTRCHPPANITFPNEWFIWHSQRHWSMYETIRRYIVNILKPWATETKRSLDLPQFQWALIVLDVYAAHRTHDVMMSLKTMVLRCCLFLEFTLLSCNHLTLVSMVH